MERGRWSMTQRLGKGMLLLGLVLGLGIGLGIGSGGVWVWGQGVFQAASGCREGAILTTEQALNPGTGAFTQERTILPGEDTTVVLGAWLILDAFVGDPTANPANPNCPSSPGDGNPLYVVRLALRPVSGDPQAVGVKTVTFWLDNDFDGQFSPGRDTQFGMPLPGSCLASSEGCVLTFGNAPIFGGPAGLADPLMGGFCLPLAAAGSCAAILVVADVERPQAGATLQVRLEGKAANLVNNPFPIGSDFSPQFAKTASSIRVRVEGAPGGGGGGGGGVLSPNVNNGSGNSEGGIKGVRVQGVRTRNDVGGLTGTPARDARPGDREYIVGLVALCDGGDLATSEVTMNPPVAGVLTIAGGLGAIPCIGPGDGDGNPINVVRVRVGVSGPGARYVQAVHVYADTGAGSGWGGPGTGGRLFEPGEMVMSALPVNGIAAVGSLQQTLMTSGGTPLLLGPAPPGGPPGLLYVTVDISDQAQASQVTVQVAVDVADIPGTPSSNLLRTQPQAFTFQITGGTAPPPGPGPAPAPGGGVQQFDTNGNCVIDDPEFFDAIDAWVAGRVDNALFFQVVDAWIAQQNVCVSGSGSALEGDQPGGGPVPVAVTLKASRSGVVFTAQGQGIASLGVRIYDPAGREVYAQEAAGPSLRWNYLSNDGRPVANGVYLYVVTVRDPDGRERSTEVRKLIVKR